MSTKMNKSRTEFQDISRSLNLLAGDIPTTVGAAFVPARVKHTIYIQRLAVHVRTVAAQALTFQDTNGTPKVLAILPASATAGDEHVLMDEPEGIPLTEGKALDITGAAGVAATITLTGFRKLTGVTTPVELAAS